MAWSRWLALCTMLCASATATSEHAIAQHQIGIDCIRPEAISSGHRRLLSQGFSPAPGRVVSWGDNGAGQLAVPPDIANLTNVVGAAAGDQHSVVLLDTGEVKAWGNTKNGQLNIPPGLVDVVSIAAGGGDYTLALLKNGTVIAWGTYPPGQPAGLQQVVKVAAGYNHSMALRSDGTVVAWGSNDASYSGPVEQANQAIVPDAIQGSVVDIACGIYHSMALLKNGSVVTWGSNHYNQSSVPGGLPADLVNVTAIDAGYYHSLALLGNGTVRAWGNDWVNQTDVPVEALANVVKISAGGHHSLALLRSGEVVAWGFNDTGATSVPQNLINASVTAIAAGGSQSMAIIGVPPSPPSPPSPPPLSPPPLPPSPPLPPIPPSTVEGSSSPSGVPVGAVVGGVVGGVAALVALTVGIICLVRRKKRQQPGSRKEVLLETRDVVPDSASKDPSAPAKGWRETTDTKTLTQPTSSEATADSLAAITVHSAVTSGSPSQPRLAPTPTMSPASGTLQENLLNEVRIPWESIEIGKALGVGGFGTVSKGMWQGIAVAVKMLNVERLSSNARDELRREALMMCGLRHPCIATVYGLVDDDMHTALVMRYYGRGAVAAIMHNPEYDNLSLSQRLQMAFQVASGMAFLHGRGILHGDLKTANLLVEDTAKGVVLADFGLSCMAGEAVASGALTVSISPPEVLMHPTAPRTPAGDVYAFSIVLLEIVTGLSTYRGISSTQLRRLVCDGHRPGIPDYVPADVAAIIRACWAQEPSSRPTFLEVMKMLEAAAGPIRAGSLARHRAHGYGDTTLAGLTDKPTFTLADLTSTQF